MFRGRVNARLEPRVTLELLDRDEHAHTIELVVDTGFDGDLILPQPFLQRLGLQPLDDFLSTLADGSDIALTGYECRVMWHGRPRRVVILESEGESLPGMNLLWRNRVTIDAYANGPVVIEELE